MPRFAMHENTQRPATSDDHGAWIDTIAGTSASGRGLDATAQPVPAGGLPRPRAGVRRRSPHLATAVGALSVTLAFTGQSVAQAAPGGWDGGSPGAPSGEYAHPCPACSLTQSFKGGSHNGIDLAASIGTPVHAAAGGTVTAAGPRDPNGFGQVVYMKNDDGTVAWYGHIDTWQVAVGEHVDAGEQIATVGNRGDSTGPHLHFEIHDPGAIDPAAWLRKHGVTV